MSNTQPLSIKIAFMNDLIQTHWMIQYKFIDFQLLSERCDFYIFYAGENIVWKFERENIVRNIKNVFNGIQVFVAIGGAMSACM